METAVRALFGRYEDLFAQALAGEVSMDEVATLYAAEFIAASPAGVTTGRNDGTLRQRMAQGYARYRAIGTTAMRIRDLRLTPLDGLHCVAHVAWTATYARDDLRETAIDFDVHYLVQMLGGKARVFGWVSGDETALLREHGVI